MLARDRMPRPSLAVQPQEQSDAEDRNSDDARRSLTRRQVRRLVGRGLHDRHPGVGQAADDAAIARQGRRARYRLHDSGTAAHRSATSTGPRRRGPSSRRVHFQPGVNRTRRPPRSGARTGRALPRREARRRYAICTARGRVDRTIDSKHANLAGTARHGGVPRGRRHHVCLPPRQRTRASSTSERSMRDHPAGRAGVLATAHGWGSPLPALVGFIASRTVDSSASSP